MGSDVIWEIDQHTRAKHELLRNYLSAWFPILTLGGFNRRVVFLDGFAGPGIYAGGEPGSPIIALDVLVNHTRFPRLKHTEFVFLFVEADKDRFNALERELDSFWNHCGRGRPSNVVVYTFNDEFANLAEQFIHSLGDSGQLAPTFAFIDPFGWSGVPLSTISRLLSSDKCEVLFNFMYDWVNRFVGDTRPSIARHFTDLFGVDDDEHRTAGRLQGTERKEFLRNLYVHQLRTVGNFKYIRAYEFQDPDRGRTAYYLMFGTRSIKGLEVIKDAMWNIDPELGVRFTGFAGDQLMLFGPRPQLGPLRKALLTRFVGKEVDIEDIEMFVIEETDFKATHYKGVLRELEEEGRITCETQRSRRLTYPSGTVIRFYSETDRLF